MKVSKLTHRNRKTIFIGIGAFAVITLFVFLPPKLLEDRTRRLSPGKAIEAENDTRRTYITLLGAVGGFIALMLTASRLQLMARGQTTDRFTRAVDQLGHIEESVRIGGIHALKDIAWDNKDFHRDVMEVLTAFVRTRSPLNKQLSRRTLLRAESEEDLSSRNDDDSDEHSISNVSMDIQTAITVIAHRKIEHEMESRDEPRLKRLNLIKASLSEANLHGARPGEADLIRADLHGANLHRADLRWAKLHGANLHRSNLSEAYLHGADLRWANLSRADLHGARPTEANLSGAYLREANLSSAKLGEANLREANLSSAKLSEANLIRADLSEANLIRADLSEANLYGANLSRANLSRADLSRADLSGADLSEADLSRADLSEADLSRADLSEANLSGAKLSGADLCSIRNWETIVCCSGTLLSSAKTSHNPEFLDWAREQGALCDDLHNQLDKPLKESTDDED
jgi:uncharacterized protein YjbI with pentapeptide repeats